MDLKDTKIQKLRRNEMGSRNIKEDGMEKNLGKDGF